MEGREPPAGRHRGSLRPGLGPAQCHGPRLGGHAFRHAGGQAAPSTATSLHRRTQPPEAPGSCHHSRFCPVTLEDLCCLHVAALQSHAGAGDPGAHGRHHPPQISVCADAVGPGAGSRPCVHRPHGLWTGLPRQWVRLGPTLRDVWSDTYAGPCPAPTAGPQDGATDTYSLSRERRAAKASGWMDRMAFQLRSLWAERV